MSKKTKPHAADSIPEIWSMDEWDEKFYRNPLFLPQVPYRGWRDIFHSLFRRHRYTRRVSTFMVDWLVCSCGLWQSITYVGGDRMYIPHLNKAAQQGTQ